MSTSSCCKQRSGSVLPRSAAAASYLLPAAALILMPKCPACVAAYVALVTGITLSIPAAGHVRTTLIVTAVCVLSMLVFRRLRRMNDPSKTAG